MSKSIWGILILTFIISCKVKTIHAQNSGKKITEIPVYSDCQSHNNKLSAIASDIDFIPIDADPPFNDFHIRNIEICDEYIFISEMTFIYQYDKNGTFIKAIGKRGNGPKEYINLLSPLRLDRMNKLIYAHDTNRNRVVVYHYDGSFKKTFPLSGNKNIELINSEVIALRQSMTDRELPNAPMIEFIDNNGKEIRKYPSHHYPIPRKKMEHLGPDMSPLWRTKDNIYYLEYGTDTIFRISGTSLVPERVLTGKLKLSLEEHYLTNKGKKVSITTPISRYNSGVFESDQFMIFRLSNANEMFFMVYNKKAGALHRTFHDDAPRVLWGPNKIEKEKKHDYFIDDIFSGLSFNPEYQSNGKAIAFIPAPDICERKKEILDYIDKHPSDKSKKLKALIQNMTDDDNSLLMVVTFK